MTTKKPTRIGYLSDKATQDAIKSLNYKEVYSKGFKQGQLSQKEKDLRIVDAYRNTADYGKGWEEVKKFRAYLKKQIQGEKEMTKPTSKKCKECGNYKVAGINWNEGFKQGQLSKTKQILKRRKELFEHRELDYDGVNELVLNELETEVKK